MIKKHDYKNKKSKLDRKKIKSGVTWTGALKLGLFIPVLRRSINKKIKIPKINFL
tara:strand:- start:32282 stop:32446 length:165 start_codon:yes stop_codon:yes gene_type:complete